MATRADTVIGGTKQQTLHFSATMVALITHHLVHAARERGPTVPVIPMVHALDGDQNEAIHVRENKVLDNRLM